jgi:putative cell wall-binding protein
VLATTSLIGGTLLLTSGPASAITGEPTAVTTAVTNVTDTTATFNGTINPNGGGTTWAFNYGTSTAYGSATPTFGPLSGSSTEVVSFTESDLAEGTTYDVELSATNADGAVVGGNVSFTTLGTAPAGSPTTVTEAASAVGTTTATVNGTINPNSHTTSYYFEYGTSTGYGFVTPTVNGLTGSTTQSVSANLGSLLGGTTYDVQLVANNTDGTTTGGNVSFTTSALAGSPVVVTEAATSISGTTAVLNGTINPEGTPVSNYHFMFGTTPSFGLNTTAGTLLSSTTPQSVSATITSLTPGATYYFELIATNGVGSSEGGTLSFVASGGLVVTEAATAVTGTTATLNGSVNPDGILTSYFFEYGTSSNLSTFLTTATVSAGSGSVPVPVAASISGLTPNTTYYFELFANGVAQSGGILSFLTTGGSQITQLGGVDAIGTSVLLSQTEFPINGSAGAVVLARSDFFSDALAGGPLAAASNGPLLITPGPSISSTIDPRVLAEIQRVLPAGGTVYMLGGDLALSPNIDATLKGLGYNVIRLAGSDEFATAVLIAQQLGNPGVIFEATGLDYYDALSAVPAAIESGGAILLTNGVQQAPETAFYLAAFPSDVRYAIGGPDVAAGADPGATAIYGASLFGTSAAVAERFFPTANLFGAATSASFSDALGGGVFMATGGRLGPLLIVNPNAPTPFELLGYLAGLAPGTPGYVFGGPLAVSPGAVAALQAAVG